MLERPLFVRYGQGAENIRLNASISHFDPTRTWTSHVEVAKRVMQRWLSGSALQPDTRQGVTACSSPMVPHKPQSYRAIGSGGFSPKDGRGNITDL
jgi:hypothetical protein